MDHLAEIREILRELQAKSPTGFAVALHISFTTPRFLFQTYSRTWSKVYSEKGLVMHDPTVRWGLEHEGAIDWDDLADRDPADVIGQARAHGMAHGLTVSLVEDGSRSVGSFSRGDRGFAAGEQAELDGLFRRLHRATAQQQGADEIADVLKRLSVELTHD
jgi:LuxR family transcriptional regulator